jgi:hypothetical protein
MSRPPQPMLAGAPERAVDRHGVAYDPRKEYPENDRFYNVWHKGRYLFPCDGVRTVPRRVLYARLLTCSRCEGGREQARHHAQNLDCRPRKAFQRTREYQPWLHVQCPRPRLRDRNLVN